MNLYYLIPSLNFPGDLASHEMRVGLGLIVDLD